MQRKKNNNKAFELVPHTADLKMRAYGTTFEELFKNALKGMFSIIKPRGQHIQYKNDELIVSKLDKERIVTTESPNEEQLLIDFLSDCLYLSDIHDEAYFDARFILWAETELNAHIFGTAITGFEVVEIKAVTYHDLEFEQIDGIWTATIVFDI